MRRRLADLQCDDIAARYLVAFSGGLDSTVLLHALNETRAEHGIPIVAIHVNHALQPDAAGWERHCRRVADKLGVAYIGREVRVVDERGIGLEAAARAARYALIEALMQDGDVLLSAHHEEDQAETLLLNLMRGSGLAGLAGIGASQRFGPGRLIRPMLGVPRQAIERYARDLDLEWIEDPSNLDLRFDRNFLRQEILPSLRRRWPAVSARLRHSAELAAESARLQDDLARLDLASLVVPPGAMAAPDRLDISGLKRLGAARQRNVLRYAIRTCGLPQVPASRLRQAQDELLPARADAQPLVRWQGAELRRYRDTLYVLPPTAAAADRRPMPSPPAMLFGDGREIAPGRSPGVLRLERPGSAQGMGIDPELVASGLQLRFRQGGEKIRPLGRNVTRPVKKLLQEHGVVPWMRHCLPLLYAGETLVAVADLWIAAEFAREGGFSVHWSRHPSIY
ncbi:MAG: tRNA lysidine(34) synthetase TilS [Woeseia sp.]